MTRQVVVLAAAACAGLTGCATLVHGSHQRVLIQSAPSGAPVSIDGKNAGVTPMVAKVTRRSSHTVLVGPAGGPQVRHSLTSRPSAWLLPDLMFWPLLVVDFASGGAFVLTPSEVFAMLPAATVVAAAPGAVPADTAATAPVVVRPPPPASYLGMPVGQRLRFIAPGERVMSEGTLWLSSKDSGQSWQPTAERIFQAPHSISLSDTRMLQVHRQPHYRSAGATAVHYGSQLAWVVPMLAFATIGSQERGFRAGAIASAAVIPIAFLGGALYAESRWAPIGAQESGSPLLVDDRLRIKRSDSDRIVSGRLVDMDASHLVVRAGSDTLRVLRTNVWSVERAEGFDWRARAMYGVAVGAIIGFLNTSACACQRSQSEMYVIPLSSALAGLLAAPALAPRRWRNVTSW